MSCKCTLEFQDKKASNASDLMVVEAASYTNFDRVSLYFLQVLEMSREWKTLAKTYTMLYHGYH